MTTPLNESQLWSDARLMPETLRLAIERFREPDAERARAVSLLHEASRVIVTGNGAAFYAALALESAARAHPVASTSVVAVPAGILGSGDFRWMPGDVPIVFSSSGELRDIVELVASNRFPSDWVAVTANAGSTLGHAATARVDVTVLTQQAVAHTQAYLANVLSSLLLWQEACGRDLGLDVDDLPAKVEAAVDRAGDWAAGIAPTIADATGGVALSSGGGWSAALETALLFKEVAGLPLEGLETREAATTGMYALTPASLVVSHATEEDAAASEAERICAATGATVIRLPAPKVGSTLLIPVVGFPFALALAGILGLDRGRNIDNPAWTTAYLETARVG